MAKRLFLLHVGPDRVDLTAMTDPLALGGVVVPVPDDALVRAGLELRRTHKAAGLRRKEVDGSWAAVARRARKVRSDCFVSVPDLFDAEPEQAALALDGLADFTVVLVVTGGFAVEPPAAWLRLAKPSRVHLLPSGLTAEQLGTQVARIALLVEEARLDKRLGKVAERRRRLTRRLVA